MEAIKSGLGLTSKDPQEGTEPLSGETGKGTTTEPFDKGNAAGKLFPEYLAPSCAADLAPSCAAASSALPSQK